MMPFPAHVIAYHYVTHGRVLLQIANQEPVAIEAGEVVVFPTSDKHRLGSDLSVRAVNAKELVQPPANGSLARIEHGGGGESTHIMCGFLGTDAPNDPVIEVLPSLLKLEVAKAGSVDWIETSLRFAAQEMAAGRPGSLPLLAQLAECLFMEAVRRYINSVPPPERGWLAGFSDPVVGRALTLLHARREHPWTVDELASEIGLSRSVFADRFTRIMGEPPMRYLGRQRLRFAAQRLRSLTRARRKDRVRGRLRLRGRVQSRVQAGIRCPTGGLASTVRGRPLVVDVVEGHPLGGTHLTLVGCCGVNLCRVGYQNALAELPHGLPRSAVNGTKSTDVSGSIHGASRSDNGHDRDRLITTS